MTLFNHAAALSLRTPYLAFSLLVSLVVSLFAWSNYQAAAIAYRTAQEKLLHEHQRAASVDLLGRNLNALSRTIDFHLLDPTQHNHAGEAERLIGSSRGEIDAYALRFAVGEQDRQDLTALRQLFEQLREEAEELFAIRADAERQHPALALSANVMQPAQTQVTDALNLAIFEVEGGSFAPRSDQLYPLLLKANLEWTRLISQMRIYLANRLSSFSPERVASQEASAGEIYQELRRRLEELIALYRDEPGSFEGLESIQRAARQSDAWFTTLQQVFELNRSERWREDSYRMEYVVIPLIELTDSALDSLRSQIAARRNAAIEELNSSSRTQLTAQVVIIALFILFLILLLSSLELLVFRPICRIAALLRDWSIDGERPSLPPARWRETRQLIDAFKEMDANIQAGRLSLQASEARFREIAENIREVFWVGSTDWKSIAYVSPYYETMFGVAPGTPFDFPQSWFDAVHPEERETIREAVEGQIAGLFSTPNFPDHRILLPGGEIKWVAVRAYRVTDKTTGRPKIIGIIEEITKQKLNEEALLRTQKLNAMRQLTGGIAHDFNNILGVILGFSEMTERQAAKPDKVLGYAAQIQRACDRAQRLTAKLLMFSRLNPAAAGATEINSLLAEERPILEKALTARVRLVYDLAPDLWPVWLDGSMLGDAILNMAINAGHAMPDGGELRIATANLRLTELDAQQFNAPPGEYVLLTLADTGVGMDRETLQRVFEPFFTTKGERGTGLGMSQVYGFVQQSKGTIQIHSEPGRGTRIAVLLPRHRPTGEEAQTVEPAAATIERGGGERILVVDDERALCELYLELLTEHGYAARCANDGREALRILERETFDLLLSDVVMPEMDGYQLAAEVRRRFPRTRIQLMSGFNEGLRAGAETEDLARTLLYKPLSAGVLLPRLRRLLDGASPAPPSVQDSEGSGVSLGTGFMEIDEEHRLLTRHLERCRQLKLEGASQEELKALLDEMLRFAGEHFRHEEEIWERAQAPDLPDHRRAHLLLMKGMEQSLADCAAGKLEVESLLEHLRGWLNNHVMLMDRRDAARLQRDAR